MRLVSLDVFRGLTIALMILVNQAGVADNVYFPLDHAPWHGWTPTDLVFPFFLFAAGMSMAFSFKKYTAVPGGAPATIYSKVLKRFAVLFALGLLLNGFYQYDLCTLRIMGVLQRIALCYLLSSFVILNFSLRAQGTLCVAVLVCYWLAMTFIPVPGYGAGVLTREGNLGAYLDRLIIGADHLHKGDSWKNMGDPEGLFSTLPAVVSTLLGYFAGIEMRNGKTDSRTSMDFVLAGLVCLSVGYIWGWAFPINKKIWTSSYTLFMGGLGFLLFAVCHEFCETRGSHRWSRPFEELGKNSLTAFVASVFLIKVLVKFHVGRGEGAPSLFEWINSRIFASWLGPYNGPTLFAVLTVIFWWLVLRLMDRKAWHLKA